MNGLQLQDSQHMGSSHTSLLAGDSERAPWIAICPGLAISLDVLAVNLLGDTLRDEWDPRLRGSKH